MTSHATSHPIFIRAEDSMRAHSDNEHIVDVVHHIPCTQCRVGRVPSADNFFLPPVFNKYTDGTWWPVAYLLPAGVRLMIAQLAHLEWVRRVRERVNGFSTVARMSCKPNVGFPCRWHKAANLVELSLSTNGVANAKRARTK